jgi:hypothetical protein
MLQFKPTANYTIRILQVSGYVFEPTDRTYTGSVTCGGTLVATFPDKLLKAMLAISLFKFVDEVIVLLSLVLLFVKYSLVNAMTRRRQEKIDYEIRKRQNFHTTRGLIRIFLS